MPVLGEHSLRRERVNPDLIRKAEQAVKDLFPIQSGETEVRASSITIDDKRFDPSLRLHQTARQTGGTLAAPVYADLELVRQGRVVQRRKVRIGTLPLMTDLGTFMVGGNDWFTPLAQLRLKPGAYTREKSNGTYETFIPMKGASMSVWMDPQRGIFKIGHRTSNVDWYPVMRALGVSDEDMVRALGGDKRARELLAVNQKQRGDADIDKLFKSIFDRRSNKELIKGGIIGSDTTFSSLTIADKIAAIKDWMDGKEVDPFVTQRTLGAPIKTVNADLLLRAAKRILDVQRGDADPDDRDARLAEPGNRRLLWWGAGTRGRPGPHG